MSRVLAAAPRRAGAALAVAALVVLRADPSCAHERSVSYVRVTTDASGAAVTLRVASRELTRVPEPGTSGPAAGAAVADRVAASLVVSRGAVACRPSPVLRSAAAGGRETLSWRADCAANGPLELESRLTQLLGTPHLSFVRLAPGAGGNREFVLHGDEPRWREAVPADRRPFDSFRLGIEHIAGGIDHLFFVLGLVLVAASVREVAIVVTAFTLAHMVTLAASALGLVRPATAPVEALIAASIALVAVENLTLGSAAGRRPSAGALVVLAPALLAAGAGIGRVPLAPLAGTALFAACYLAFAGRRPGQRRVRWVVAFVFGLLHGFGFAGALLEAGFSRATAAVTLVAFNAGVEAGQLLFVAMLWPLLLVLRRRSGAGYERFVVEPASVVLLAASVAWYAVRTFGPPGS